MNTILSFLKAKKIYVILIIALALFLLIRAVLLRKPDTELTYTVKKEDLIDTVQVSGTYTTASQTQVTSPTNGIITELYVTNTESVKKGDPLFHVDSTATADQQKTAYANYTNALNTSQTALNTKQSLDATMWTKQQSYLTAQNNQNYKNTHTQNPATKNDYTELEKSQIDSAVVQTQKDFEAAQQAFKSADTTVTAAQATVATTLQAYQETQSTTVTAPASGTIANLLVREGDQVGALQPTSPSQSATTTTTVQPVLVIANLSNPYISINISEDYAVRVTRGQKAVVVFDALKDRTFMGRVTDLATVGTNIQGVVTYAGRIVVNNLPSSIKPNMSALIAIETLRKNNVIDAPNSAIISKRETTYVLEAKSHKQIPVKLGLKGITKTEITEGLSEGIVIVANPE